MIRFRSISATVVAMVALLVGALSATGALAYDTVRILFQPVALNGALFVAEKEGYFERQRIKVNWVPLNSQDQAVPILALGRLEVGFGLTPAFYNAVARGEPLRFVADRGHVARRGSIGALFVRAELAGAIRSVADLKGRKIALPGSFGNLGHYMLIKALAGVGLTFTQVTVTFMPPAAVLPALQSGAVDAAFLPNPLDTLARERSIGVQLIDLADIIPGEHIGFLVYGRNLLVENRPLGVRVMVAYLQGVRRYGEGPTPRNVAAIAEYTKTDPEIIRRSGWIGIHPDGYIDVNKARRYQDWLYEVELISVRNPMSSVIDTSFAEQARGILGLGAR